LKPYPARRLANTTDVALNINPKNWIWLLLRERRKIC